MNTQRKRNGRDGGTSAVPVDRSAEQAEVLSDRYCRQAIAHLDGATNAVEVSELAREVAAAVRGEPPEEVPDNVQRRIQTLLHHGHLPSLADHGIVAFDPETGRVRLVRDGN